MLQLSHLFQIHNILKWTETGEVLPTVLPLSSFNKAGEDLPPTHLRGVTEVAEEEDLTEILLEITDRLPEKTILLEIRGRLPEKTIESLPVVSTKEATVDLPPRGAGRETGRLTKKLLPKEEE